MASPRSDDLSSDGDAILSPSSRDHDLLSSGGKLVQDILIFHLQSVDCSVNMCSVNCEY